MGGPGQSPVGYGGLQPGYAPSPPAGRADRAGGDCKRCSTEQLLSITLDVEIVKLLPAN